MRYEITKAEHQGAYSLQVQEKIVKEGVSISEILDTIKKLEEAII